MTRSRKVLLVIIALAVLADFLPVTREEFSWWWAQSHNHSADYLRYLSDWPAGRHDLVTSAQADFCRLRFASLWSRIFTSAEALSFSK
jgi:hypothetical protein